MTTQYRMLSDGFIQRFRSFMSAENNPAGAFDAMPKTQPKENQMSKRYRYVPLANTGGQLFLRERSNNMAYDDVSHVTEFAQEIINFLHDKISEQDMARVEEMLKMEAGVKTDQMKESDKMVAGAEARRAGAQDSAARIGEAGFNSRFPSARRIGTDPGYGFR
jgi:adenine-specific DNA glycosylase